MWGLILDAQESQPLPDLNCMLLSHPQPKDRIYTLDPSILQQYVGRYASFDGEFEGHVFLVEDWLALKCTSPMQWTEYLIPQSPTSFILEDSQMPVHFNHNAIGESTQIELRWRWKDRETVFHGENVER